jgi:hypothetical protein
MGNQQAACKKRLRVKKDMVCNQCRESLDGSACYHLGRIHELRADGILSCLCAGNQSHWLELEWAEAMRSADACYRDAVRKDFPGAAASICELHQIEPGQMRPIYLGDKVRIHGLVPMSLRHLNERKGVIASKEESSWDSFGCFGVAIDGIGIKYIHPANLTLLGPDDENTMSHMSGGCACDRCFQPGS